MRPFTITIILGFSIIINAQQCPGSISSKGNYDFDSNIELFAPPKKAYNIVGNVGRKFFFGKKDFPKLVGYKSTFDVHPSAFAICKETSDNFEKSRKIAGKTRLGYIWLENKWINDTWAKGGFKLKPELIFLIGHEAVHILHRKDVTFQRQVKKREDGKFIYKKDSEGNYLGLFSDIPDKLKDHAEELHGDYGGGLILYDVVLYKHDNWVQRSEDDFIRDAHEKKYNLILKQVEKFIRAKLAPEVSTSHGSADERVSYFLKGVADRKKFINELADSELQKATMKGPNPDLINSLKELGKLLRAEYKVKKSID